MPASASGSARDAMIPGSARSKGPSHFNTRQPGSNVMPGGRFDSRQTIDNSSCVLEIETNRPLAHHCGTSADGSRRQIAYRSGNTVNVRSALGFIPANPCFDSGRSVTSERAQQPVRIAFLNHELSIRGSQETLRDSSVKQREEWIIVTFNIQNPARLPVQPKLRPSDDLAKLFKRAIAARHCDEGV